MHSGRSWSTLKHVPLGCTNLGIGFCWPFMSTANLALGKTCGLWSLRHPIGCLAFGILSPNLTLFVICQSYICKYFLLWFLFSLFVHHPLVSSVSSDKWFLFSLLVHRPLVSSHFFSFFALLTLSFSAPCIYLEHAWVVFFFLFFPLFPFVILALWGKVKTYMRFFLKGAVILKSGEIQ